MKVSITVLFCFCVVFLQFGTRTNSICVDPPVTYYYNDVQNNCLLPPGTKISSEFSEICAVHNDYKVAITKVGPYDSITFGKCERQLPRKCELAVQSLECSFACPVCNAETKPGLNVGKDFLPALIPRFPIEWPAEAGFPCNDLVQAAYDACKDYLAIPDCFLAVRYFSFEKTFAILNKIGNRSDCTKNVKNPTSLYGERMSIRAPFNDLPLRPNNWNVRIGQDDIEAKVAYVKNQENKERTIKIVEGSALRLIPVDGQYKARFTYKLPNFILRGSLGHIAIRFGLKSNPPNVQAWKVSLYNFKRGSWVSVGTQRLESAKNECVSQNNCKWVITTLDVNGIPENFIEAPESFFASRKMQVLIETGGKVQPQANAEALLDFIHIVIYPDPKKWTPEAWVPGFYEDKGAYTFGK